MKNEPSHESDIEQELRRLRPSSVDPEVMNRWLEFASEPSELGPIDSRVRQNRPRLPLLLLAAVICLTGFVGVALVRQAWDDAKPEAPAAVAGSDSMEHPWLTNVAFQPNSLENHIVDARDDGVIGSVGEVPFRRVRYQLMDTYRWENPTDGSRLEMMIPREEILLLPVVTY